MEYGGWNVVYGYLKLVGGGWIMNVGVWLVEGAIYRVVYEWWRFVGIGCSMNVGGWRVGVGR